MAMADPIRNDMNTIMEALYILIPMPSPCTSSFAECKGGLNDNGPVVYTTNHYTS